LTSEKVSSSSSSSLRPSMPFPSNRSSLSLSDSYCDGSNPCSNSSAWKMARSLSSGNDRGPRRY
jgi:hypothetical protein